MKCKHVYDDVAGYFGFTCVKCGKTIRNNRRKTYDKAKDRTTENE
jgi:hypothetical protein